MQIVFRSAAGEQELDVDLGNPDATLGDLVAAVDGRGVDSVAVDGRVYPASCALADAAIPTGALVAVPPTPARRPTPATAGHELVVVAGPEAGARFPLRPGRTTIGRGPDNTVRLQHPTVARAQCVLDLDGSDAAHLTDLGARNRTVVDGVPLAPHQPSPLSPDAVVETGALALAVRPTVDDRHRDHGDRGLGPGGGIPFNRPPRSTPLSSSVPLEVPDEPRESDRPDFSVTTVVAPLILAGVLIAATQDVRFALFALLSPVLGIGMYVESRRRVARRNRQAQEKYRAKVEELGERVRAAAAVDRARLRARHPDPAEVLRRAALPSARLWERRRYSTDFLELCVGIADVPWEPELQRTGTTLPPELADRPESRVLRAAPAVVELARGGVVGIVGNRTHGLALARNLLCQAAVHHGPADLTVGLFVDDGRGPDWDWAKWLPHTLNPGGEPGARWLGEGRRICDVLLTDLAAGAGADAVLVVIDSDVLTTGRDSPARTVLQQGRFPRPGAERAEPRFAGIVLASTADHLPAACDTVVEMVDDEAGAVVRFPLKDRTLTDVLTAGTTTELARGCARDLARFEDPELHLPGSELPDLVRLLPLLSLDAVDGESVRRKWRTARVDGAPRVTLGVAAHGVVTLDLDEHGPHGLVGGTTGSGKSELLRTFVVGLAAASDPRLLTFVLVDYKGGAAFDRCAQLPHTVGLLTDLDAQLGERALTALKAELHHRERRLRKVGADNIIAYRRLGLAEPMPRLVVVIDEFATLAKELPDFVSSLVDVAQRGRTLGVHLILATQRPSGAVNENIKANTNLRIALQMLDAGESKDIVDVGDAAGITRKGRALVRLSRRDLAPMQTALVTCVTRENDDRPVSAAPFGYGPAPADTAGPRDGDDQERGRTDLDRLVEAIIEATALEGIAPPRRPWPEPLPAEIPLDAVADGSTAGARPVAVVARADDPGRQDQYPVGWALAEGNLTLLGVPGSGTTTALASVALALAAVHTPDELELQVLDFGVGGLAPLAELPHVGSVVLAGDRERQVRLLRHVVGEFARRRATVDPRRLVLLVDNLPAMRAAFDDAAGTELMAQLARVVADGQSAGISVVLTADRPQSVPTAFSTTQQWLFRLADTIDYTYAGIDRRNLPAATPGRAVVGGTSPHRGLHVQVGRPLPDLATAVASVSAARPGSARVAHTVEVLPTRVGLADLKATARLATRPWLIPVAMAEADLGGAALQLFDEEHALIAGPARSGRSTALWTVAESLRRGGTPVHIAGIGGARSPLRDCPALDRYAATAGEAAALAATLRTVGGPVAVLIDDADRLDDTGGALDLLFTAPVANLHVIAAANNDSLRTLYGHWTKQVRASRCGLLLRPNVHMDGDLLGTTLPPRAPVEMATGRGYLVTNGEAALVQVAVP